MPLSDARLSKCGAAGLGWCIIMISQLVDGIPTPLKNMKVSWEYYSQYMEKYGKMKMFQTTNQSRLMTMATKLSLHDTRSEQDVTTVCSSKSISQRGAT